MATRKIETEIALSGEAEFNSAMKAVNSNLKTLRSDMALVTARYEENAGSMDALTAKQQALDAITDQQRAKVAALTERYQYLASSSDTSSAALDRCKLELNNATAAMLKAEREARKNAKAIEEQTAALEENAAAASEAAQATGSAKKETSQYIPITQRAANALKSFGGKIKDLVSKVREGSLHIPTLGEALDSLGVAGKGSKAGLNVAQKAISGMATASGAAAKGIGAASATIAKGFGTMAAGAAKGVAVITAAAAALGTAAVSAMASYAKEAAEAAQAAKDAGDTLTESQQKWLDYSDTLTNLDSAVSSAKTALGGVLLPMLSDLSTLGAQFLSDFSADMEAAGSDTQAQTQVMADYIVKGATLIKEQLPEYVAAGKELISGLSDALGDSDLDLMDLGLDLVMEIVEGLVSASPAIAQGASELLSKLASSLGSRSPELTKAALGMVKALTGGLSENRAEIMAGAKEVIAALSDGLASDGPELLDIGVELTMEILTGIMDSAPQLAETAVGLIGLLIQGLSENGPDLLASAADMVVEIVSGLAAAAPDLIPAAGQLIVQLVSALGAASPELLQSGVELVVAVLSGIWQSLGDIGSAADEVISTFLDGLAESDNEFLAAGANMIKGIWQGISDATQWLYDLISGWADSLVGFVKDLFGIHSPSTVFADQIGAWMPKGVGVGWEKEWPAVKQQINESIDTTFDIPDFPGGRSGSNGKSVGRSTITIPITIYTQKLTDADVEMLVTLVDQKLGAVI